MAALWNRAGHFIFVLWFLLFFLAYSQLSHIGCLLYFHTWCGHSANLESRSEMCCTQLAENTGRKNSPPGHHCKLRRVVSSQLAYIDNWKKLVKQQYLLHTTYLHNMVNFGLLTVEIILGVWGTPANFNEFCVLPSVSLKDVL